MLRAQPGNTSAFLINHEHRPCRQHLTQIGHQAGQLGRVPDVAGEQDDTGRRSPTQQCSFCRQQVGAG